MRPNRRALLASASRPRAESFFGTLKSETEEEYESRAEARAAITDYIDNYYNLVRMHSSLDYLSPIEYELRHQRLQDGT